MSPFVNYYPSPIDCLEQSTILSPTSLNPHLIVYKLIKSTLIGWLVEQKMNAESELMTVPTTPNSVMRYVFSLIY